MTEHIQINDIQPRIHYVADGVQSAFSFPFAIFRDADLEVWLGDGKQTTGYTVSGAGISTGGTAIFAPPPPPGTGVTLRRRLALARTTDYQVDGLIRAKTLNDELDFQVAAVQQVAEELERTVKRSPTSASTADLTLPEPAPRRGLRWNDDGTALVNTTNDPDAMGDATQAAAEAIAARDIAVVSAGGVRVSPNDTLAGPLTVKLVAGEGITLTESTDGGDERLTVATILSTSVLDRLAFLETNLAVNTLRDQIDAGWSVLKMVDGWADEFEDESGILKGYTSDLCTGGTAISGGYYTMYLPSLAFDNALTGAQISQWVAVQQGAAAVNTAWIGYDFGAGNAKAVRQVTLQFYSIYYTTGMKVQYSDDAVAWLDATSISPAPVSTKQTFALPSRGSHRYWRLLCTAAPPNSYLEIDEVEMMELPQGSSDGQVYDSATDRYRNETSTTATNSSSSGWGGAYVSRFVFAANGDIFRTDASWNFGVYRSSADLTGDFEYSFTQRSETGNGGAGANASFQFGVSLVSGFVGGCPYNENVSNLFFLTHSGVGASQTITFYRQQTAQASVVRAIAAGDVFTLRRRGSTLTAEHNGVTLHTFAGFATTAPCFQALGHGGTANENPKPTFGEVRWSVNQTVTNMTLASQGVLAASTPPVEARLVLLHQPVDAVTPNTDLIAEVSRDGGVTWTAVELADEGAFDATTTILAGTANIADQPTGTAMKWRVRTLNNRLQSLHGVWIQWR